MRQTVLTVLLAGICLVGCPHASDNSAKLYTQQSYHGYFAPTDEAGIYNLHVTDGELQVTWYLDRPERDAGQELFPGFLRQAYGPQGLVGEPVGSVAYRLDDGVWEVVPAQFLGVRPEGAGAAVWRVRLLGEPPRSLLTGVTLNIDDKGKHETDEQDTGVYTYAAGAASFEATGVTGRYRLVLAQGLPELMLVGASPGFQAMLERADLFTEITWPSYFADDAPNAALTVETTGGVQRTLVLVLTDPQWNAAQNTLSFTADVLLGDPEGTTGPATLFIDDWNDREDTTIYKVVVNHEEQYSIWPADRADPLGWDDEGFVGSKQDCLTHIEQIWTDMRPLSLRRAMQQQGSNSK
jgi:MbtH protein